jgi:phosphatidylglycerol lysyltransferase
VSNKTAVSLQVSDKGEMETSSKLARVREIVLKCGWNSTSYQIINPGIRHWFATKSDSVVGFVSCNGVRVVAGAPISAKETLKETAAEFESVAAENNESVCYCFAEQRLESFYEDSPNYSKVLFGAQPIWQPRNWAEIIKTHKSLRAQLNRSRNKGVTVAEWLPEKAHDNPLLKNCLHKWLGNKGLPPLRFLVEPETLKRLFDRRIFVAEQDGKVVGFVVLSPIAQRNGWLFEQFPHHPDAPNGTVELMIDTAMRALAKDGYEYATLGLAPLSTRAEIEPFNNPLWLRFVLAWMRKHGQRFYNFDGLDAFKAKLQPESWEPVFAISNRSKFSPRTLYAIASAFSGNAPVRMFVGGILRAIVTEVDWLRQKIERKLTRKYK